MMSKEFCNWIPWEVELATTQQTKVVSHANFPWWFSSSKNIYKADRFFPEMLMIKESFNLVGQKVKLTTPNQKRYSQMMLSLHD